MNRVGSTRVPVRVTLFAVSRLEIFAFLLKSVFKVEVPLTFKVVQVALLAVSRLEIFAFVVKSVFKVEVPLTFKVVQVAFLAVSRLEIFAFVVTSVFKVEVPVTFKVVQVADLAVSRFEIFAFVVTSAFTVEVPSTFKEVQLIPAVDIPLLRSKLLLPPSSVWMTKEPVTVTVFVVKEDVVNPPIICAAPLTMNAGLDSTPLFLLPLTIKLLVVIEPAFKS